MDSAGEGRQEKGEAGEPHPAIAPMQQFNADLESLFEFAIVIVVRRAVHDRGRFRSRRSCVAVVLFLVVRPISVLIALAGVPLEREQRVLA